MTLSASTPDILKDFGAFSESIFFGNIHLFEASPDSRKLRDEALGLLTRVFREADLQTLHHRLSGKEIFERLSEVRKSLRETKYLELCRSVLAMLFPNISDAAFDVPRLRCVVPGLEGIAQAKMVFSFHRDTWYANPQSQINIWIPFFDVSPENSFAFYPSCFQKAVANDSGDFDYTRFRELIGFQTSKNDVDQKLYPTALEDIDEGDALRFSCKAADMLVFSAAQLHRTLPVSGDRMRLSLDFRFVALEQEQLGKGAPNVDNDSRGSALSDYWPL